ncbi:MAG: lysylphosphatidylglycerol synthase transmembrane domain-containing protein [Mariprofundales bacterium]
MTQNYILFVKLFISLLLLFALFYYVDVPLVWERLRQADWLYLSFAFVSLLIGYVVCGLRWAWLARGLDIPVSSWLKIRLFFLGVFVSLFLPSTIGGDVARGVLLAGRHKGKAWAAAASVFVDRLNGLYALSLLLSGCLLLADVPNLWLIGWFSMLFIMWFGLLLYPWFHKRFPDKLAKLRDLPVNSSKFRSAWWASIPLSMIFQILIVQVHVWLGLAVGLDMPWVAYGVMVCSIALASVLPISFNGFGIREAGYVGLAIWFGGSQEAAAAMAALWVILLFITAIPGGIVLWSIGGHKTITQNKKETIS